MVDSIGGAGSALIGLQALDFNNSAIRQNVGLTNSLRAPGPDSPSSIVSTLRSGVAQLKATKLGLVRGETIVTVSLNAGDRVQSKLVELRSLADRASDKNLSSADRDEIATEFQTLREELDSTVSNATFDNVNLIEAGASDITIVADEAGRTITVAAQDLSASGLGIEEISVSSSDQAADAVSALDNAIDIAADRFSVLGEADGKLRAQGDQREQLVRLTNPNVGVQINTELTEQEASLLAGEVRDNLGVNRLSIANVQSQSLLALARG